jgi:hypothetical protein
MSMQWPSCFLPPVGGTTRNSGVMAARLKQLVGDGSALAIYISLVSSGYNLLNVLYLLSSSCVSVVINDD